MPRLATREVFFGNYPHDGSCKTINQVSLVVFCQAVHGLIECRNACRVDMAETLSTKMKLGMHLASRME